MAFDGFDDIIKSCLVDCSFYWRRNGRKTSNFFLAGQTVLSIGARRYEACGTEFSVSDKNSLVRGGCVSRAFQKGVILSLHPKEHDISAALKDENVLITVH